MVIIKPPQDVYNRHLVAKVLVRLANYNSSYPFPLEPRYGAKKTRAWTMHQGWLGEIAILIDLEEF
jgi:hypothetical protein